MLAVLQFGNNAQHLWETAVGLGAGLLAITVLAVYVVRKSFQTKREEFQTKPASSTPSTENASAFMAASMQAVIQQLRDQEKELERLHKIEKERAEQTERLS